MNNRLFPTIVAATVLAGLTSAVSAPVQVATAAVPFVNGLPRQSLAIAVDGLRSQKGMLQICLTRFPNHFPDCTDDPDGHKMTVKATRADNIAIADLPEGNYALAIVHDENGNNKLDTFAGIPREGVGFSRNPRITFGAPSFRSAKFVIGDDPAQQGVRMKYFL